jgi:hypothetical protein
VKTSSRGIYLKFGFGLARSDEEVFVINNKENRYIVLAELRFGGDALNGLPEHVHSL